jgi:hypothetical protein
VGAEFGFGFGDPHVSQFQKKEKNHGSTWMDNDKKGESAGVLLFAINGF